MTSISFSISNLQNLYRSGEITVEQVIDEALRRATNSQHPYVWITLLSREKLLVMAQHLSPELPLYGIPFAIKDNIDLAGIPTTCGCPEFAYTPTESATIVSRLMAAGAIPIGKTNLDQFATGLNGTRSPHGAPRSVFNADYISGGSSSGSSVAVASGMVSFSLGTDTAGSGRVPAALNHIVGYKPSKGWFSGRGVFPACRSQDCATVFAGNSNEVGRVAEVVWGFDPKDAYSRAMKLGQASRIRKIGCPVELEFFGNQGNEALYRDSLSTLANHGYELVEMDYTPLREAAQLLYAGPWVAERRHALGDFFLTNNADIHPVVREIISKGDAVTGAATFEGFYRLQEYIVKAQEIFSHFDALLLPTAATTYTVEEMLNDPVQLNTNLGYYTNFVNLLDLAAVAVPAGFSEGLPFGVTFIAPAGSDESLLTIADDFHRWRTKTIGITTRELTNEPVFSPSQRTGQIQIAVVGAHLSGQPLNHQLTSRNGLLVRTCCTAKNYRLYHLPNTEPPKPGLVRTQEVVGEGIELEIWTLGEAEFGSFVASVPQPMVIGTVLLEDGTNVKSFLCEPIALDGAKDITNYGSWRSYLASR